MYTKYIKLLRITTFIMQDHVIIHNLSAESEFFRFSDILCNAAFARQHQDSTAIATKIAAFPLLSLHLPQKLLQALAALPSEMATFTL